jgi:hypothetical protein
MSGIELCRPVYSAPGVALAFAASILLGMAAVRIAYSDRGHSNILLGTAVFGLAVFCVHFLAMGSTGFVPLEPAPGQAAGIGNQTLALLVTLSAFVISGAFLLTGITFFPARSAPADPAALPPSGQPRTEPPAAPPPEAAPAAAQARPPAAASAAAAAPPGRPAAVPVPYEKEGRTLFVESGAVAALRAEGHYCQLHHGAEQHLCPWSISEAEARLAPAGFLRVHRSFLVNPRLVTGFERGKDGGQVQLASAPGLGPVPVSRNRLADLRAALGI